jgi:DNA-binding GntR family transcriptional regulator
MPSSTISAASGLIKNHLSDELHSEILDGSPKPGERFVVGKGAAQFGVVPASIREGSTSQLRKSLSPTFSIVALD